MPTTNPRVNVTLSPSTDLLLRRLAVATGQSKSNIVRELIETAEPALGRVVALMTAAKGAQRSMLDDLALGLDRAQSKAEAVLEGALSEVESTVGDLVAQAEAVRARKPTGAGAVAAAPVGVVSSRTRSRPLKDPPSSNRGVKSPKPGKAVLKSRGKS